MKESLLQQVERLTQKQLANVQYRNIADAALILTQQQHDHLRVEIVGNVGTPANRITKLRTTFGVELRVIVSDQQEEMKVFLQEEDPYKDVKPFDFKIEFKEDELDQMMDKMLVKPKVRLAIKDFPQKEIQMLKEYLESGRGRFEWGVGMNEVSFVPGHLDHLSLLKTDSSITKERIKELHDEVERVMVVGKEIPSELISRCDVTANFNFDDPSQAKVETRRIVPKQNGTLTFGEAIEALKKGQQVYREGWNGKRMFLSLIVEYGFTTKHDDIKDAANEYLPWIGMKTVDDGFLPWFACHSDILATDWWITNLSHKTAGKSYNPKPE